MAVPTVALFFAAGGWVGMACLATIWGISNFELEALNYLENYGIIRVTQQLSQVGSSSKLVVKLTTMIVVKHTSGNLKM